MLRFTLSVWVPQAEKHRGIEPAAQPQSSLRLTAFPARDTHVAKQRKVSELEVEGVDVTSLVRAQAEKRRAVRKPTAYAKHRLKSTVRCGRRHRTPSKG